MNTGNKNKKHKRKQNKQTKDNHTRVGQENILLSRLLLYLRKAVILAREDNQDKKTKNKDNESATQPTNHAEGGKEGTSVQ